MYSTVQAVLVFDLSNFMGLCSSESEIEHHIAKIKLVSLKLLLNFGAKTERAVEGVRWSWKFYDSRTFRPDTSRKQFLDLGRKVFSEFESELTDKYCKAFDNQEDGDNHSSECRRPHSFVLKKALQEVLLDYNWDGPDISSPVKTTRRKNNGSLGTVPPLSSGTYNAVVVVANVPRGLETTSEDAPEDFLANVLDSAMAKAFKEDKKISLSFVELWEATNCLQPSRLSADLTKLSGSLHNITDFIQTQPKQVARSQVQSTAESESSQNGSAVSSQQVQLPWRSARTGRPRKPQRGPTLVWEDAAGISHLSIQLKVLAVYGSCSRVWGSAAVVGAVHTSQVALLALAQETASLFMCVAACETFGALITVLATHQLSMVLRLSGGSLALLSPWGEGAGCLALVSASGLAALAPDMPDCPPSTLQFVSAAVRRCLKDAAPHTEEETVPSSRWFSASMIQCWFRPIPYPAISTPCSRNRLARAPQRRAMLERLQKRYRPQIPQPLATGETGPLDLVDITQPPVEPQAPQATLAKPTMTRAQQLLKKSHIVTAQQRVKEQLAEEEERVQATERRAAQACERALKSQALETQVLNTVSDPQDERELVQSLMGLRETAGVEADIFTTAQTIINLALVHVKNTTIIATPATVTMQEGLGRVLGCGVLQSAAEILHRPQHETHLHQYKLQTLLHLELLWVLGYSACSKQSEGREEEEEEEEEKVRRKKEHHVEEVIRLLRAISLHHDPTTMANFLQETVLENYLETLGEVLLEVYEELNQPLPPPLQDLAGDLQSIQSNWLPPSVKSQGSPAQYSESPGGSGENPGSGRSKEGRRLRLRPHPSLQEANKRSIVVPKVTRALSRTHSEQTKTCSGQPAPSAASGAAAECSGAPVKNVCRNLFELGNTCQSSAKSHIHPSQHTTPKKPSLLVSKVRQPTHITPVKKNTIKSTTPRFKKGGKVLIPETPENKVGSTVFNHNRCHKSMGTTCIGESPDLKMSCRELKTTPRRLRASLTAARRNSFYSGASGARSRNWERARAQLLADHIRGHADRRPSDTGFQQLPTNASFLFSNILSASQILSPQAQLTTSVLQASELTFTPDKKDLDSSLNTSDDVDPEVKDSNCVMTKLTVDSPGARICAGEELQGEKMLAASMDLGHTPVKRVRRALLLSTPSKVLLDINRSPEKTGSTPGSTTTDFSGFSTPTKNVSVPSINRDYFAGVTQAMDGSMVTQPDNIESTEMLPTAQSKRVHFTLKVTPNTPQTPKRSGMPKSILKTPIKTPLKSLYHSPTISSKQVGSLRKESTVTTPYKHGPQEDVIYPSNSVVKVGDLVSHSESELELLSPSKIVRQPYHLLQQSPTILKYPKMSLKLESSPQKFSRSPKKSRSSPSRIDMSSVTSINSVRKLAKRLDNASSDYMAEYDNAVRLTEIDVSLLPNMPAEDINLVNSLLFGAVEASDSEIPVLELSEDSYLLEHPANLDNFEVCNSDSDGDDTSVSSPHLPDLEATVALHTATEEAMDFGCMSPVLLPNLRDWYNHRADSGGGVEGLASKKEVSVKANSAFCGMTQKEVILCQDLQDSAGDAGSTHEVAEGSDFSENLGEGCGSPQDVTENNDLLYGVTVDSGSSHGAAGNTDSSHDVSKNTDCSHYVAEDTGSLMDVTEDTVSSVDVTESGGSSQDIAEDSVSSQYVDEDTESSQDVAENSNSSQCVAVDTESSQGVAEDTESSQGVAKDTSSSQGVAEDTGSSEGVYEDTGSSQDVAEDTGSSQDVAEYTGSSLGVAEDTGSAQSVVEDTGSSQDVAEDTGSSQGVAEDTGSAQGVVEDTGSAQGVAEDTGSSQDVAEDTGSSQDLAEDTESSQGVAEDTGSSQGVAEDTGSSQGVTENSNSSQGVADDIISSCDVAEDTGSSQDVAEDTGSPQKMTEDCSSSQNMTENSLQDVTEDTGSSQDVAENNNAVQSVAEDNGSLHDVADDTGSHYKTADTGYSHDRVKDANTVSALHVNRGNNNVLIMTEDGCSALDTANDVCTFVSSKDADSLSCAEQKDKFSLAFDVSHDGSSSAGEENDLAFSKRDLLAVVSNKVDESLLEASVQIKEISKTPRLIRTKESSSKSAHGSAKMDIPTHKRTVKKHQKGKRRMSTSSEEEPNQTVNQENVNGRRILRERTRKEGVRKPRQAAIRACRKLADSVQEVSSDDNEEQGWYQPKMKKRIFESILTPEKINGCETTLPLKNVENLPHTQDKPSYIDTAPEDAESIPATSVQDTGGPNDTLQSCVQQEHNFAADFSKKLLEPEHSFSPSFLQNTSPHSDNTVRTNKEQQGKLKKKNKGVKLTLTRSGDQYQVTKTQISQCSSDPNSSGDLDLHLSCSDLNDNLNSSKSSIPGTSGKTSKRGGSMTLLTPHRFTRHMSRDISVSPELYQQLITLSPQRISKKPKVDALVSKEKHCNNSMGHPMYASTPMGPGKSEEWWVSNMSDSPTTKTFVRRQKRKHQITVTPRVKLPRIQQDGHSCEQGKVEEESTEDWSPLFLKRKPARYSSPSIQSLLQLSSDKILLDQSPNHTRKDSPGYSSIKRQQNFVPGESSATPSPSNNLKLRSSRRLLYSTAAE